MNRRLKKLAGVVLVSASAPLIAVQVAFGNTTGTTPPANAATPTTTGHACRPSCPAASAGWVAPSDAPLWGGFRTTERPNHLGVDIGAARGTPIRAAAAGTVARVRCNVEPVSHGCDQDGSPHIGGCGWYVDIRHAGNVYTRYCHMLRRPSVKVGQVIDAGEVIGVVGSSGNSSAPHLHFEVRLGHQDSSTAAVDPVPFMAERGAPLGAK